MSRYRYNNRHPEVRDYGSEPLIVNIDRVTKMNSNYRTALWTGKNLQLTLMCIPVGGDIGLEIHEDTEQFIRIESGCAEVMMGRDRNALNIRQRIDSDYAVIVPAGTWHNIVNVGSTPLKLYSIYAPPHHPFGTVHRTKACAEAAEK